MKNFQQELKEKLHLQEDSNFPTLDDFRLFYSRKVNDPSPVFVEQHVQSTQITLREGLKIEEARTQLAAGNLGVNLPWKRIARSLVSNHAACYMIEQNETNTIVSMWFENGEIAFAIVNSLLNEAGK